MAEQEWKTHTIDKASISKLIHILWSVFCYISFKKKLLVFVSSLIILPSSELLTAINRYDRTIESLSGTGEPDQFNLLKLF